MDITLGALPSQPGIAAAGPAATTEGGGFAAALMLAGAAVQGGLAQQAAAVEGTPVPPGAATPATAASLPGSAAPLTAPTVPVGATPLQPAPMPAPAAPVAPADAALVPVTDQPLVAPPEAGDAAVAVSAPPADCAETEAKPQDPLAAAEAPTDAPLPGLVAAMPAMPAVPVAQPPIQAGPAQPGVAATPPAQHKPAAAPQEVQAGETTTTTIAVAATRTAPGGPGPGTAEAGPVQKPATRAAAAMAAARENTATDPAPAPHDAPMPGASMAAEAAPALPPHGIDPTLARAAAPRGEATERAAMPATAAPELRIDARAGTSGAAEAQAAEAPRAPPQAAPARQVVPAVVALAISGGGRISVTLEPVELGRVEISVERNNDVPQVVILAERPETLALLQRDQRELDRALTQAGLPAEGRALSFGLSGGDAGSGQSQRRQDAEGRDGAARGVQSRDTAASPSVPAPRPRTLSLLDLAI